MYFPPCNMVICLLSQPVGKLKAFDALYIIQVGDPEYDIVVESIAGAGDERTNHTQKNLGLTLTDKPILTCTLYRVLIVGEEGLSLLFNFNLPDMKRTK